MALPAIAFALTFLLVLARRLLRLPTLDSLARRTDERFGLHGRLGTALELARRPASTLSLVEQAVIEDTTPYAVKLRASQVVPFRWPSWAWGVPLLAITAAAASLVAPTTLGSSLPPPTPNIEQPATNSVSSENLRRVSDALSRDPEISRDPYLSAVAREFKAFTEGLEVDKTVSPEQVAELGHLLGHLERATVSREDTVGRLLHTIADSGLLTSNGRSAEEGTPFANSSLDDEANELNGGDGEVQPEPPGDLPEINSLLNNQQLRARADLDTMLDELDRLTAEFEGESDLSISTLGRNRVDQGSNSSYDNPESRDKPSGQVQVGEAAGAPVGVAQEADNSPGDAAGHGAQQLDLARVPDGPFSDAAAEVNPVQLPEGVIEPDGAYYEVEGVPSGDAAEASTIHGVRRLAAHRVDEGAIMHEGTNWSYREVVRRYFLPGPLESADAPDAR